MELTRCARGHVYDAEKFPGGCPECKAMGAGNIAPTGMGMPGGGGVPTEPGPTTPVGVNAMDPGKTMPVSGAENGATSMVRPEANDNVADYSDETQRFRINDVAGFTPVTGWLVSIEGPTRGEDYQIYAGYNYIGRGEDMDICIRGDMKIGRERHALIGYDSEERVFFFGPADGKNIVRVNGKMVLNAQQLSAYDILTIGSTKLIFVPLCGETFNWEE